MFLIYFTDILLLISGRIFGIEKAVRCVLLIYLCQENYFSLEARGYTVEILLKAVAQTLHTGAGEHPGGGGRSDSLVPRPSTCGLSRPAGPATPRHWQEGLVRHGQMSPVSPRPRDVLHPPQVSHLGSRQEGVLPLRY